MKKSIKTATRSASSWLEKERQRLVVQNAGFKKQLSEIEDRILKLLSEAGGDILEDEELINTLSASKVTSDEINVALAAAEKTEANICLLYTSPSPRDATLSRMPSSA